MKRTGKGLALIALVLTTLGLANGPGRLNDAGQIVTLDVAVTDKDDNPVAGLVRGNFKVFEDNVERTVTDVAVNRKPLAMVILVEFSDTFSYYQADVIDPAAGLIRSLEPEDWGALVAFDMEPEIVTDFTHDKRALIDDLQRLEMPLIRGAALYDAVYFVLDRIKGIEEKAAVVLLASGFDTKSRRRTLADALKKAEVSDAATYTVSPAQPTFMEAEQDRWDPGAGFRLNEAEYTLRELAEVSGGLSFRPMFPGQFRRVYEVVNADLRHQYTLSFVSGSKKAGGKLRKLKVEVGGTDVDHNGKPDKLNVRHKKGFN